MININLMLIKKFNTRNIKIDMKKIRGEKNLFK